MVLDRVRTGGKSGKVIYTYKTRHSESGLASNDTRTYTELGDLVTGADGHGVIFASEAGTDNAQATSGLNEARNVGFLLVAPTFDTISQSELIVPPSMILSEGTDSPLFGFYNFGGGYVRQQYRGVRWLTTYEDKESENAARPKMVGLANGKRLVLWEKWTPDEHVSTHGLLMDSFGNVTEEAIELDGIRLSDGDGLAIAGERVFSVTANGHELVWSILELDHALAPPIPVLSHSVDRTVGRVEIEFISEPGRAYRLETSRTLASGSWIEVEGSSLVAHSASSVLVGAADLNETSRFWRVAEED